MRLGDDPATYYVVGTAFAMPDEPESTKARTCDLFTTLHAACFSLLSSMRGGLCRGSPSPAHQGQGCSCCFHGQLHGHYTFTRPLLSPLPSTQLQGRIFVLAATGGKFQVVCEKETRGAVRCPPMGCGKWASWGHPLPPCLL